MADWGTVYSRSIAAGCDHGDAAFRADQHEKRNRLKCLGVGRDAENPKALVVSFNRTPSDGDLREVHDKLSAM